MAIRPSKRPSELTKQRAKELRANATLPEVKLWEAIRGKKMSGLKFRRQHPIEPFIVDFYCADANLVIELDGRSHDEQIEYDGERDEMLNSLGLTVLRIPNDEVLQNLDGVCEAIHCTAAANMRKSNPK